MPIPMQAVADWVTSLGWDGADPGLDANGVPVYPGPYVQKSPDRIVTISSISGPGYIWEGSADMISFQARVRGRQSPYEATSYTDAEALAFTLDQMIFNAPFPVVIDGKVIVKAFRNGPEPSPLGAQPDDADRYEFVSNYMMIVGV
jgi:hypothetical protein